MKKRLEILSFYTSVPKIMIICYTIYGMWRMQLFFFSFWAFFFCPFTPVTAQRIKISISPGDTIILLMCNKNYNQMIYGSWDMVRDRRTDGLTDEQMDGKSGISRWVPDLRLCSFYQGLFKALVKDIAGQWILYNFSY